MTETWGRFNYAIGDAQNKCASSFIINYIYYIHNYFLINTKITEIYF